MVQIRIGIRAPAVGIFILDLHHEHIPALLDLVLGDDVENLRLEFVHIRKILRVIHAQLHPRLVAEPRRNAAVLPLGADIRPGPHDGIHPALLDRRQPRIEIQNS